MIFDMSHTDLAIDRFRQGYSCSQAVFSVLAEPLGIHSHTAFRIAAGFGGGIARSGQTCGCVTGAIMALGLRQQDVSPQGNTAAKAETCELARRMMHEFVERNGSTECRVLLGCDIGTPQGYEEARRNDLFRLHCVKLVSDAVEIVNLLAH
jgi:C_GCAxxG_C_C family probable redox protein